MKICAPDLPFLETVAWHLKQFGAGLVIILFLGCLVWGFLSFEDWKNQRRKK